jgi:hypothetical protein
MNKIDIPKRKCISRVEIILVRTNFDGSPLELGIYYRKKGPESPDRPEFHSSFLSEVFHKYSQKLYKVAFTF